VRLLEPGLVERAQLDDGLGAPRDRVHRLAAEEQADVDVLELREQLDEAARRARAAAVAPGVAAGAGDGEPDADAADGVDADLVEAVTFERDGTVRLERRAGVARAAQAAEPLLADGEDHGERLVELGREPFDDGRRDGDGERVVADPRALEPAVALDDLVREVGGEDGVDMREEREPERRPAEPPDEVADLVARALARRVGESALEPREARVLAAGRGRDLREGGGVPLDIRTNVGDDSVILLNQ